MKHACRLTLSWIVRVLYIYSYIYIEGLREFGGLSYCLFVCLLCQYSVLGNSAVKLLLVERRHKPASVKVLLLEFCLDCDTIPEKVYLCILYIYIEGLRELGGLSYCLSVCSVNTRQLCCQAVSSTSRTSTQASVCLSVIVRSTYVPYNNQLLIKMTGTRS